MENEFHNSLNGNTRLEGDYSEYMKYKQRLLYLIELASSEREWQEIARQADKIQRRFYPSQLDKLASKAAEIMPDFGEMALKAYKLHWTEEGVEELLKHMPENNTREAWEREKELNELKGVKQKKACGNCQISPITDLSHTGHQVPAKKLAKSESDCESLSCRLKEIRKHR